MNESSSSPMMNCILFESLTLSYCMKLNLIILNLYFTLQWKTILIGSNLNHKLLNPWKSLDQNQLISESISWANSLRLGTGQLNKFPAILCKSRKKLKIKICWKRLKPLRDNWSVRSVRMGLYVTSSKQWIILIWAT